MRARAFTALDANEGKDVLKAQTIGNLGNDPELQYSASGQAFLRFNVASNYRTRVDGEWQDATEWVRVTVFGARAETLAQHLKKGQRVYADGRLEARPWTDNSGNVRAGLELVANDVEFMSSRQDDGQAQPTRQPAPRQQQPAAARPQRMDDGELQDLPF